MANCEFWYDNFCEKLTSDVSFLFNESLFRPEVSFFFNASIFRPEVTLLFVIFSEEVKSLSAKIPGKVYDPDN